MKLSLKSSNLRVRCCGLFNGLLKHLLLQNQLTQLTRLGSVAGILFLGTVWLLLLLLLLLCQGQLQSELFQCR